MIKPVWYKMKKDLDRKQIKTLRELGFRIKSNDVVIAVLTEHQWKLAQQ